MNKEQEAKQKQERAYRNRDSIRPGDQIRAFCTKATREFGEFRMMNQTLSITQPPDQRFKKGHAETLTCYEVRIGRNGYGLFVDYYFEAPDIGQVIINGPDAQWLRELQRRTGV